MGTVIACVWVISTIADIIFSKTDGNSHITTKQIHSACNAVTGSFIKLNPCLKIDKREHLPVTITALFVKALILLMEHLMLSSRFPLIGLAPTLRETHCPIGRQPLYPQGE